MPSNVADDINGVALLLAVGGLLALFWYFWAYGRWADRNAVASGRRASLVSLHLSDADTAAAAGDLVGHAEAIRAALETSARELPDPPDRWVLFSGSFGAWSAVAALAATNGGWEMLRKLVNGFAG